MKRFHVHVSVGDLDTAIRFYSMLFAAAPVEQHPDYAKWMLDDPRINFAVSRRGLDAGVNHMGFQLESAEELQLMRAQLQSAEASVVEQSGKECCYARSDKHWITDPAGVPWETFHTLASIPVFGEGNAAVGGNDACCLPTPR